VGKEKHRRKVKNVFGEEREKVVILCNIVAKVKWVENKNNSK
jgi:hypothetical protein